MTAPPSRRTGIPIPDGDGARADELALGRQVAEAYGLHDVTLTPLPTPVNDVFVVTSSAGRFALKLYHGKRTGDAVRWEVDLVRQLRAHDAPVVQPIRGSCGYVQALTLGGSRRLAVLYSWAPGAKPAPSHQTYHSVGQAAALIHAAGGGIGESRARERYDATLLVDHQLHRIAPFLEQAAVRAELFALGARLTSSLDDPRLDWGICHMDLTLDNVHLTDDGTITVFDFDSAGPCWRAAEAWGVMRFSVPFFETWLAGYRTIRPFTLRDAAAVAIFGIVGDLRTVAWKLGVADSSRGTPSLTASDLPGIVEGWLAWESTYLR